MANDEAREKDLSWVVHLLTRWIGSLPVSVAVFCAVTIALCVGVVSGFPQWWQTILYSTNALVTLLMLFVIQHTTNQQTGAILLKLDELIHTSDEARDEVKDAEDEDVPTQERLHERLHH
jgi:low affinity Fe/Cu permease